MQPEETQRWGKRPSPAVGGVQSLLGQPWENHGKTMGKWWENGGLIRFIDLHSGNLHIALEHGHRNREFSHETL